MEDLFSEAAERREVSACADHARGRKQQRMMAATRCFYGSAQL